MTKGIELPNLENITILGEKETYKIFGNIRSGHNQTSGDERKKLKRVF